MIQILTHHTTAYCSAEITINAIMLVVSSAWSLTLSPTISETPPCGGAGSSALSALGDAAPKDNDEDMMCKSPRQTTQVQRGFPPNPLPSALGPRSFLLCYTCSWAKRRGKQITLGQFRSNISSLLRRAVMAQPAHQGSMTTSLYSHRAQARDPLQHPSAGAMSRVFHDRRTPQCIHIIGLPTLYAPNLRTRSLPYSVVAHDLQASFRIRSLDSL